MIESGLGILPSHGKILSSLDSGKHMLLWTDGSALSNPGYAGSGVFIQSTFNRDWNDLEICHPLTDFCTSMHAEFTAILLALQFLSDRFDQIPRKSRLIILSDCLVALRCSVGTFTSFLPVDLSPNPRVARTISAPSRVVLDQSPCGNPW